MPGPGLNFALLGGLPDDDAARLTAKVGRDDPGLDDLVARAWLMGARVAINQARGLRTCRVCGCHDTHACPEGCAWVGPDLCSACEGS